MRSFQTDGKTLFNCFMIGILVYIAPEFITFYIAWGITTTVWDNFNPKMLFRKEDPNFLNVVKRIGNKVEKQHFHKPSHVTWLPVF